MTTFWMRRPVTRSVWNSRASNGPSRPDLGTRPVSPKTRPPTVSHSSCGKLDLEQLVDLVDRHLGVDADRVVVERLDERLLLVVLVDDLADDLFDQVLDRDESGRSSVFVHHDRHVDVLLLHLAQELGDLLLLGNERRGRGRADATFDVLLAFVHALQEVLRVEDPDDVVVVALVDRDPRVAGLDDRPRGPRPALRRTGRVTMSGRGTMTSRTTVSPNSKTEWISSRSSSSISSSSSATSTMCRISSSVTKGPFGMPRPGRTGHRGVGDPDEDLARAAAGRVPGRRRAGPSPSAARSVRCTVYVFGTDLGEHEQQDRHHRPPRRPRRVSPNSSIAQTRSAIAVPVMCASEREEAGRRSGRGPDPRRS